MIHIYGHTWPVRWGLPGEEKTIKVFSNCTEAELFVNGVSAGVKTRDSSLYPAAGLSWAVKLNEGANTLRAVGRRDGSEVSDEIHPAYQTAVWSKPAKLVIAEIARTDGIVTIEARVFDRSGVPCLDASNRIRFGLTGDGRLLDNLGTADGSRDVQLANGRARISLNFTGPTVVTSVASEGIDTGYLNLKRSK